ncbi:MAG: hypothetical protein PSV17_07820 [Methylotenera sp.]|uniref:hypothetical protein n=1 Tax=Methylotenera sp. TaxID=2051956 RepID=UPI0024888B2E|nr:hypothetical protein [Methylotenera sp.]MDI1309326.1 hypothetical protein [Methylotenera sp.]
MSRLHSIGEVNWKSGSLRPFESAGSVGAKYCYLNKVKPIEFGKLIEDLVDGDFSSDFNFTFDNPKLKPEKISKIFGEPLGIAKQLSLLKFLDLRNLNKCDLFNQFEKNLRFCPECLNHGYHSPLHQLNWLTKCFIHNSALQIKTTRSKYVRNLNDDSVLLTDLYELWFENQDFWKTSKNKQWKLLDCKNVSTKSYSLLSELKKIENRFEILEPFTVVGANRFSNLNLNFHSLPMKDSSLECLYSPGHFGSIKPYYFKSNKEETELISKFGADRIVSLIQARQIYCEAEEVYPQWKLILEELKSNLLQNHFECLAVYKKSFIALETLRVKHNPLVRPPYNMDRFDMVPCKRIGTLKLSQLLFEFESKNLLGECLVETLDSNLNDFGRDNNFVEKCNQHQLISKWCGKFVRNQHEFLKSYEPGHILGDEIPYGIKQVRIFVPMGSLIPIIDELLLMFVYSWAWALYELEIHADKINYYQVDIEQEFKSKVIKLSPSFLISTIPTGIQILIGTKVESCLPNFTLGIESKNHNIEVLNKAKKLTKIYDFALAKSLEDYDRARRAEAGKYELIRLKLIPK